MIRAHRSAQLARQSIKKLPKFAAPVVRRAFSTSVRRMDQLSDASKELVQAIRTEQKFEAEAANETSAEDLKDVDEWAKKNQFEINVSDGNEQVQLVKKVSPTETLRIFFSISDVVNADQFLDEDPLPESAENNEGDLEEELETPIRVNIVVEKPNGAISIESVVQEDLVLVESVIPYASAQLALDESAEADYTRRQQYQGPPFGVLDPSLQSAVQHYLESRGLNEDFAFFVQEYASFRENKEYTEWLGRIAHIIES